MHIRRISASMSFDEASEMFIAMRTAPVVPMVLPGRVARYVSDRTLEDYRDYAKRLSIFFGPMRLEDIQPFHLAEYQRMRLLGEGFTRTYGKGAKERTVASPAGANKINQELGYLGQVMRRAGCWGAELEMDYDRFERSVPDFDAALSWDQQQSFLEVAASRPEWEVLHWYALLALHVCFSSDEMRTLLQGGLNLTFGILGVNRRFGKNQYRRRDVSLTDGPAIWAAERMLDRAKRLGCAGPNLFLLPFRSARNSFNGAYPMGATGLRKPFEEVRAKAGVPWFRFNGFRHTACTRLAEAGVRIEYIQERSGHHSPRMTRHYVHISEAAQRIEMMRAQGRRPPASVREMPKAAASA
jgi:integrase